MRTTPPLGSDQYAGGDDNYAAGIEYSTGYPDYESEIVDVKVTWNQLFYELGPLMLEEANEAQMCKRLDKELWLYDREKFPEEAKKFELINDNFETIKIQLLALGLIKRSERKHVPSDTGKYWSLTPFGETALMKLRAIPKKPSQRREKKDLSVVGPAT